MRWNLLYDLYEKRVRSEIPADSIPRHIGVILDGNRRWAKAIGTTASISLLLAMGKTVIFAAKPFVRLVGIGYNLLTAPRLTGSH